MNYCLPKELANKFIGGLKDGSIDPAKLADMTSKERHSFFEKYVGKEHALDVNALFESKLLLKNQQAGMISWARTVAGLKPEIRRDIVTKIEKLDKVLDAADQESFLNDLANRRLGIGVTFDEAKRITELSRDITNKKQDLSTYKKRVAYGEAILDMQDYLESLNPKEKTLIKKVENVANLPKTVMSTLDFSAPLRQGWGMISRPEFYSAFKKMFSYARSEKAYREMQADIISRPTYDAMKAGGLRTSSIATKISQREEAFMSNILDKVPFFKGSERAYTGFLNKLRADVFDSLLKKAELRGEDVSPRSQTVKDIAAVVNDFTGSGNIGKGDRYANAVPALNAGFFSPRKLSATINMFNPERYLNPEISATARRAALRNLVGSVTAAATVLAIAKAMNPNSVETDPRSADFGKIKSGDTRFDITGGNGTFAVLLARLFANSTKSSTSGNVYNLGEGYKPTTRADLVLQFGRNKLSPLASLAADWLYGSDSIGTPFKLTTEVKDRVIPLIISDAIDLAKNDPSNAFVATLASMFGIGVQNYSNAKK